MRLFRITLIAFSLTAFVFASCKKQCTNMITVDAGPAKSLQLPTDTISLTGTVTSGQTANMKYFWTLISGPNSPVIANADSATAQVSGFIAGTYVFQFQATNSYNNTAVDTVSVTVLPAPVLKTLVLQPSNNPYEGVIDSYFSTAFTNGRTQLSISAWTHFGSPENSRQCIKFDYSGLPNGAVINDATLYLYTTHAPIAGDLVNADSGPTNSYYVQRITSNWVLPTPFTWNSQPSFTTTNEVTVPQSTSSFQDDTVIVTSLVKDMQVNGNNGFFMQLLNETPYNARQYESSFNGDASLNPKLIITYY